MADSRSFHAVVTTPSGVALGGWVDLEVRSNGATHVHFHMHGSSVLTSYDFSLRAYLQAPNCPTIALISAGHTAGVDSWDHEEDASNPLIAASWGALAAAIDGGMANFFVQHDWSYSGVFGTVEDVIGDIVEAAGAAVGAGLGVIIGATRDAIGWLHLDLGPGAALGVIAGVAVFLATGGVGGVILAVVGGAAVGLITDAMIERRALNEAERVVARSVFADSLDLDAIEITNLNGVSGRPFTIAGVDGKTYVNLGPVFDSPLSAGGANYPAPGQVLIHELTHAWQIQHNSFLPGLMCSMLVTQAENTMGDNAYEYAIGGRWDDYNPEQQGAIVDQWFGGSGHGAGFPSMSPRSPNYPYVRDPIRGGREIREPEIVWHHAETGETQIWFMDGGFVRSRNTNIAQVFRRGTVLGENQQPAFVGLPFHIVGCADMDHDGAADIVWYNDQTGETQIWFMDQERIRRRGTVIDESGNAIFIGPPFRIVACADMDRDGNADIIWYNSQTGETQIWFMDRERLVSRGTVIDEAGNAIFIGPPFRIVACADMDRDGNGDIVWYNDQTGETQIWFMDHHRLRRRGTVVDEAGNAIFIGPPFRIVACADMDRDGNGDIVWYNDQTGETQIWFMSAEHLQSRATVIDEQANAFLVGPPFAIVGAVSAA
jgi:hypothetical protein